MADAPSTPRISSDTFAMQLLGATEHAPASVRAPVEAQFGVDLTDVRVHRGDGSSRMARALDARVFTDGADVHLPRHHGDLERGGAPLLAHELTHVAQRRRLGGDLPDERSSIGRALEREAHRTELLWAAGSLSAPVRDRPDAASDHPALWRAPRSAVDPIPDPVADTSSASGAVPAAETTGGTSANGVHRGALDAPAGQPQGGAHDHADLDDLARRLYDRIRSQLRAELLVDRERSGLISDLR